MFGMTYFVPVFFGWALYFALHSLLASEAVKRWVARRAPAAAPWYRVWYNGIALLLFVPLLWYTFHQPADRLHASRGLAITGALLAGIGAGLLKKAFSHYNVGEFLGWQRAAATEEPLITSGLNARVRHPLYLATAVFIAGLWLLYPTAALLAVVLAAALYLPIGIYLEEKKLLRQYGQAYRDYQQRVTHRLIPGIW